MEPQEISATFDRLIAAITAAGGTVGSNLRPGIAEADITRELAEISIPPHPHLLAWFGHHDGAEIVDTAKAEPGRQLGGSWRASQLAELLQERASAKEISAQFESPGVTLFPSSWFPISAAFNGILLCLDTSDESGQLFEYDPERGDYDDFSTPAFGSIVDFVDAYTYLLENGLTKWLGTDDGGFEMSLRPDLPPDFAQRYPTLL